MFDIDHVPQPRSMSPDRRAALRAALVDEVEASGTPWWRRSRRTLTVGVGAASMVLAGGAVATAAYVTFRPATDLHSVVCYSSADLDQARTVRAAQAEEIRDGEAADTAGSVAVDDAIGLCADVWRSGALSERDDTGTTTPTLRRAEPPGLTACTLRDGVAGVFPGDERTCTSLQLPRLDH